VKSRGARLRAKAQRLIREQQAARGSEPGPEIVMDGKRIKTAISGPYVPTFENEQRAATIGLWLKTAARWDAEDRVR
jgi:hypothetical protein